MVSQISGYWEYTYSVVVMSGATTYRTTQKSCKSLRERDTQIWPKPRGGRDSDLAKTQRWWILRFGQNPEVGNTQILPKLKRWGIPRFDQNPEVGETQIWPKPRGGGHSDLAKTRGGEYLDLAKTQRWGNSDLTKTQRWGGHSDLAKPRGGGHSDLSHSGYPDLAKTQSWKENCFCQISERNNCIWYT